MRRDTTDSTNLSVSIFKILRSRYLSMRNVVVSLCLQGIDVEHEQGRGRLTRIVALTGIVAGLGETIDSMSRDAV